MDKSIVLPAPTTFEAFVKNLRYALSFYDNYLLRNRAQANAELAQKALAKAQLAAEGSTVTPLAHALVRLRSSCTDLANIERELDVRDAWKWFSSPQQS